MSNEDRVAVINSKSGKDYYNFLADKKVREHFFAIKGSICEYCGRVIAERFNMIIEHKTSYHESGGTNNYENLALACRKCNSIKKSLTEDQLYDNVKFQNWVLEPEDEY